jgi:hypothetical protein
VLSGCDQPDARAASVHAGGIGPQAAATAQADDPHAEFTCSACHALTVLNEAELARNRLFGADTEDPRIPAPEARCSNAGCHEDAGPREVTFNTVTFEHRNHGEEPDSEMDVAPSCAGCHTHGGGNEPLTTSVDTCSLCHLGVQAEGTAAECQLCHVDLSHAGATNQQVDIPHESLPWVAGGCARCHYDLSDEPVQVSAATCADCHAASPAFTLARDPGAEAQEDLHPDHLGLSCMSCHEGNRHGIQEMSGAVTLSCGECHGVSHGVEVSETFPSTPTCVSCHADSHGDAQRILLGIVPTLDSPQPSEKFMDGLSCSSCHTSAPAQGDEESRVGTADGCLSCHRAEFGEVLEWWNEGLADRMAAVETAASRARRAGGAGASARLDSAQATLALLESGNGVHNITLSHRLLEEASGQVARALAQGGQAVPASLEMGRTPRQGTCSFCHYRVNDPWSFGEMTGEFHAEVRVGRTR